MSSDECPHCGANDVRHEWSTCGDKSASLDEIEDAIAAERARIVAAIRAGATSVAGPASTALHAVADALEAGT